MKAFVFSVILLFSCNMFAQETVVTTEGRKVILNEDGTWTYGDKSVSSSSLFGVMKDLRDGQIYKTVKIKDQIWMAENLNFKTDSGSWCYNNDLSNGEFYGRLYPYDQAVKVCPEGWHLPSMDEWEVLINNYGGMEDAGKKLKCSKPGAWFHCGDGTNESGFSALPGGGGNIHGSFHAIKAAAIFWALPEDIIINIGCDHDKISSSKCINDDCVFSVRCIKDKVRTGTE